MGNFTFLALRAWLGFWSNFILPLKVDRLNIVGEVDLGVLALVKGFFFEKKDFTHLILWTLRAFKILGSIFFLTIAPTVFLILNRQTSIMPTAFDLNFCFFSASVV